MQFFRSSSLLARLFLAWFVLTLSVASASPLLHPQAMEIVCSAGGAVKVVFTSDDGSAAEPGQHTLDCSLCLAATLPLPQARTTVAPSQALAYALQPIAAAHIAARIGAALPARGPPVSV